MGVASSKALQKQLEKKLVEMGKIRDGLDEIIENAQGQRDAVARAIESVEEARDALSELV